MNKKHRIKLAKQIRKSGNWLKYLQSDKDTPCFKLKKYKPGDVVHSFGGRVVQKDEYVYIGSFRSRGKYGLYLLLNAKGKIVKHDNICHLYEIKLDETVKRVK